MVVVQLLPLKLLLAVSMRRNPLRICTHETYSPEGSCAEGFRNVKRGLAERYTRPLRRGGAFAVFKRPRAVRVAYRGETRVSRGWGPNRGGWEFGPPAVREGSRRRHGSLGVLRG